MIIVLTGSTGCVGQALVRELKQAGHEVITVGRQTSNDNEVASVLCDLSEPFSTESFPARADAVIHLAQSRRYREFPVAAGEVFAINVAASQRLADYWATPVFQARRI